jgi:hypothetical protein
MTIDMIPLIGGCRVHGVSVELLFEEDSYRYV